MTISANVGTCVGASASFAVTLPVTLQGVSLSTGSVRGGLGVNGTVSLSGPAPAGGATVSLDSSNTLVASVPASVMIPAGQSSATFSVSTNPVAVLSGATVTATFSGVSKTASLSVTPL